MATTLEIINGISQVLANSYDGALDESGEPVKIGLRREEGNPLIDHRVIDGKQSVSFLVRVKECIEDPTRLLMHI